MSKYKTIIFEVDVVRNVDPEEIRQYLKDFPGVLGIAIQEENKNGS